MSSHIPPVTIGFYDPFEVYPKIKADVAAKIQLTNLHWRKTATEGLRSIPKLPFDLVEETPKYFDNNELGASHNINDTPNPLQSILDLLKTPYTRIMFFQCEQTETYKSQVRPLIQAWKEQNIVKANVPVDWYIIYYISADAESKHHQRVFEKLKTDFSDVENVDRYVKLKSNYLNALEETETWNTFSTKLKDGVLHSFSSKLQVLRDAILSENSNESLTSIVLKEGIARQFLNLHLFEDALGEYDHLQYLVHQSIHHFKAHKEKLTSLDYFIQSSQLITSIDQQLTQFNLKSYVFAKQFIVLEALSDSATSLSIASLHISEFLKRLEGFINEISTSYGQSTAVWEWGYKTINEVLNLDICVKIIENEQNDESLNQISERFGELILLLRSKLLSIGSTFGYSINGVMTDLAITTEHEVLYEPLRSILKSQESFEDQYITLTELAVKHFSISGRPRTVDALSIDIALLDYQNKQYGKAALVLANCPEFYGAEGWDFIGFHLLEAYIDCLENIEDTIEYFNQSKESLLASTYVLLLSSSKLKQFVPKQKLQDALQKLLALDAIDVVEFPLEKIFSIDVSPFVKPIDGSYEISLTLEHLLPLEIELHEVSLTLIDDDSEIMTFSAIGPREATSNKYVLISNHIIFGNFKVLKCSAKIGPVTLLYDFTEDIELITYPSISSTRLTIGSSKNINLSSRTISAFLDTKEELDSVEVTITPLDGLEIQHEHVSILDGDELIDFRQQESTIIIKHLSSNKTFEIVAPYIPNPKSAFLDLLVELKYSINGVSFSQTIKKSIDSALSIAVSVQDIYKNNGLYSNFTIGTADVNLPIRILNVDLKDNARYEVKSGLKPSELIAFGEQPGNYFFKIDRKLGEGNDSDSLILDVEFRDLSDELSQLWKEIIFEKLRNEGLESYSLLFSDTKTLEFNYQLYAIDSVLKVLNPDRFNWKLLNGVRFEDRSKVKTIIRNFLKSSTPALPTTFSNKHLFIDVSIPLVKVIHTVELKFPHEMIYTILGEQIHVELNVKSLLSSITSDDEENGTERKKVSFKGDDSNVYDLEILNVQDTWLINGKTKFSFELDKHDSAANNFTNYLTLIPLKVGKITLPKVKITNESFRNKTEFLMEIDYKNENETIYVVSERS